MLTGPKDDLERAAEQIRNASALNCDLIRHVVTEACTRLPLLERARKTVHDRPARSRPGAWCDAALALIGIELPAWKRSPDCICEDGEWFCSLTPATQPPG